MRTLLWLSAALVLTGCGGGREDQAVEACAAAVSERHAHCAPSIPLDAFAAERLGVRGKSGKFMDPIELLFIQLQDISVL